MANDREVWRQYYCACIGPAMLAAIDSMHGEKSPHRLATEMVDRAMAEEKRRFDTCGSALFVGATMVGTCARPPGHSGQCSVCRRESEEGATP